MGAYQLIIICFLGLLVCTSFITFFIGLHCSDGYQDVRKNEAYNKGYNAAIEQITKDGYWCEQKYNIKHVGVWHEYRVVK